MNGQQFPALSVPGGGEIWLITNTSGSRTYDLNLWNAGQNRNMLFQIISVDGVGVDLPVGTTMQQISEIAGSKFKPLVCPGSSKHDGGSQALCTNRLLMMPSSRVEVFVSYRDSNGNLAASPNGANAVFRTDDYNTGPAGDSWPSADVASVQFVGNSGRNVSQTISVHGDASKMAAPVSLSTDMQAHNHKIAADPNCTALAPGHMRRIYFAAPTTNLDAFGLAYEEIDERGHVVGKPANDVSPFDPMKPTICLPLGPNNTPQLERWQLVNLAGDRKCQTLSSLLPVETSVAFGNLKGKVRDVRGGNRTVPSVHPLLHRLHSEDRSTARGQPWRLGSTYFPDERHTPRGTLDASHYTLRTLAKFAPLIQSRAGPSRRKMRRFFGLRS